MSKAIHTAVQEAREKLKGVVAQIDALWVERRALEAFIRSGETIAGKGVRSDKAIVAGKTPTKAHATPSPVNGHGDQEMWQNAVLAVNGYGRPVTASQLVKLMEKQGTPVGGKFKRENMRAMLKRKKDVFEKVGTGLFALKVWPDAQKQARPQQQVLQ